MKALLNTLHHRSLTLSLVASIFALIAISLLRDYGNRTQHRAELAITLIGLSLCIFTFINLLHDKRNGYASVRCSLATILLALALGPIGFLGFLLTGWFY